jgi:Zn-dependent M28 family amino/carboxypeptidase
LQKAAAYIEHEFKTAGLVTHRQSWTAAGQQYDNVVAIYNAEKKRRLIIGAHYDVCGDQPGADDNASAVAGLLESVRLVAAAKPEIDYAIEFVAYCLEEPPFYATPDMGSYVHAKSLHDSQADVVGMICFEMIGYFSDEPNSQPYPDPAWAEIYPNRATFIVVVGISEYKKFNHTVHQLMSEESGIDVQAIDFDGRDGLASMSDHRNYWKFGYPALMINDTSFLRNPNYHLKSDTIETLDFARMTEVVTSAYKAIVGMS